ncbi:MAG: hypothetical protein V4692_01705, partial [Bdellovibrionota bacterium]
LYPPKTKGFKGKVKLLVNEWCISSCTGFVWSMRDQLKKQVEVVGMYESGDSAYARLYLDVYLDPNAPGGFRTEVNSRKARTRQNLPDGALLRQQVAVTRSTDSKGRVISATPAPVDLWVPHESPQFGDEWEARAFKAALDSKN